MKKNYCAEKTKVRAAQHSRIPTIKDNQVQNIWLFFHVKCIHLAANRFIIGFHLARERFLAGCVKKKTVINWTSWTRSGSVKWTVSWPTPTWRLWQLAFYCNRLLTAHCTRSVDCPLLYQATYYCTRLPTDFCTWLSTVLPEWDFSNAVPEYNPQLSLGVPAIVIMHISCVANVLP